MRTVAPERGMRRNMISTAKHAKASASRSITAVHMLDNTIVEILAKTWELCTCLAQPACQMRSFKLQLPWGSHSGIASEIMAAQVLLR